MTDAAFTPQRYLDAATRQQDLQRVLLALTEVLLTRAPLRFVTVARCSLRRTDKPRSGPPLW